MKFHIFVLCCVCVNFSQADKDTYRAATIKAASGHDDLNKHVPLIYEAGKSNVDILVLPSSEISGSEDNYDESVKNLAKASRQAGLYVVAHLYEKTRCRNKNEIIRSNVVFNREGTIVSVYRKPINVVANCTAISSDIVTFTTDFGVTFGLVMEEDLTLQSPGYLKNLNNFVVAGVWSSEIPFLSAAQFSSPWAYTTNANLISHTGIYSGRAGMTAGDRMVVADLGKNGGDGLATPPVINPTKLRSIPGEDLSQYIIRPLDLEASSQGYKETVCHRKFCCEFYVKTDLTGPKHSDVNYGLAAFDGVRHFGSGRYIGAQTCAVFACAGLYKRSCSIGSENSTLNFENISVTGNFTKHNSIQYPIVLSTASLSPDQFSLNVRTVKNKQITVTLDDAQLLSFGIFGRDFAKDFESSSLTDNKTDALDLDIFDYIFNENVQEFIDYLWIRLRILIFVVSIYILEMM